MKVKLMLRVNSEKNGVHLGKVDQIQILDLMDLEGKLLECYAASGTLVIDGLRFNLKGYANWVGNWCWDQATVEHVHVPRILKALMDNGWWLNEAQSEPEADSGLWEMWHRGQVPTADELLALMRPVA